MFIWSEIPSPRGHLLGYEWSPLDSCSALHPYPPPTATWCCFQGTEARSSEYQERVNASPELWKKLDFFREAWQCEKRCNQFHFLINKWSTGESWPVSLGTLLTASFKEPVCLCLSLRGQTARPLNRKQSGSMYLWWSRGARAPPTCSPSRKDTVIGVPSIRQGFLTCRAANTSLLKWH